MSRRAKRSFVYSRSSAAFNPSSTWLRRSRERVPMRSVSFLRSSVVSWWHKAILAFLSPPTSSGTVTAVGPRIAWVAKEPSGNVPVNIDTKSIQTRSIYPVHNSSMLQVERLLSASFAEACRLVTLPFLSVRSVRPASIPAPCSAIRDLRRPVSQAKMHV